MPTLKGSAYAHCLGAVLANFHCHEYCNVLRLTPPRPVGTDVNTIDTAWLPEALRCARIDMMARYILMCTLFCAVSAYIYIFISLRTQTPSTPKVRGLVFSCFLLRSILLFLFVHCYPSFCQAFCSSFFPPVCICIVPFSLSCLRADLAEM